MRKIAAATILIASLGAAGCQARTDNSGTSVTINGQTLDNGLRDAGNFAADAGNVIGNEAAKAGVVIENTARAGWNELKGGIRDLNDAVNGDGNTPANAATANTTGR